MTNAPLTTLTPREGVAGIALLAMTSDGVIAPEEDEALRDHLSGYAPFDGVDDAKMSEMLVRLDKLAREKGDDALLAMSCAAVGRELAPVAFLVAADILAADGVVALEESDFIVDLKTRLGLSDHEARLLLEKIDGA